MPNHRFGATIAERLKNRSVRSASGCLLWQGPKHRGGYGLIAKGRTMEKAHRAAWELANGPIPEGLHVCHRCDIRHCIEPSHLFLGTHADNMADMWAKGRGVSRHGEEHWDARLSKNDVIAIRADTRMTAVVSAAYGVSKRHIRRIRSGEKWRHI